MGVILSFRDETTTGQVSESVSLEFVREVITVEELIRERILREVESYNANIGTDFRGLVQPTETERALNGFKFKNPRKIDWEVQLRSAKEAFAADQILVLIDNKQADSLSDTITIEPDTDVVFLKLVPLVGG